MFDILSLIGREREIFLQDIENNHKILAKLINGSSILVIGGAGSIGQATVKELFKRNPKKLYVVDLSENNLSELVRDLRSSLGYIDGDFKTFALDSQSTEFEAFFKQQGPFDYVLNLSALKHVRSERDPYTLMRMIQVNIVSIATTLNKAAEAGSKKYFSVSTDKAVNPVNFMGATKRVMENILFSNSYNIDVSTARFANVAFSDGSLLYGFNMRLMKNQPIAAPFDVKRYFITPEESGRLCMLSAMIGENRDIFFPKLETDLHLVDFKSIAESFLLSRGLEAYPCKSEEEAREKIFELKGTNKWPCFFSESNTTGEKAYEEFFTSAETVALNRFKEIGVILNQTCSQEKIQNFLVELERFRESGLWEKDDLLNLLKNMVPEFDHKEKDFYLDGKM